MVPYEGTYGSYKEKFMKSIQYTTFDASYLKNFFDMIEDSVDLHAMMYDYEVDEASFEIMVAAFHRMKNQL